MTPQVKKRLAKEWKTLLICLVIGFLLPLFYMLVVAMLVGAGGIPLPGRLRPINCRQRPPRYWVPSAAVGPDSKRRHRR